MFRGIANVLVFLKCVSRDNGYLNFPAELKSFLYFPQRLQNYFSLENKESITDSFHEREAVGSSGEYGPWESLGPKRGSLFSASLSGMKEGDAAGLSKVSREFPNLDFYENLFLRNIYCSFDITECLLCADLSLRTQQRTKQAKAPIVWKLPV